MSISWQIPRNCLAWILLSQLALIVPHGERLPLWVIICYGVCALWRVMVYQGRWSLPSRLIKVALTALCFGGIYQTYGTLVGLEPTVALLFTGLSLKLLEISKKRDVYVLIFLAYFTALTAFLFTQDFSVAAFVLLTLLLVTTALVALHQQSYDELNMVSLRKSTVIFLQAIPLMVLLFIVFPRFGPLWSVPTATHQAKTGISDSLSPGDISELSENDALAFRAVFEGEIPRRRDMYWRGLVLSEFDGRRWQQGSWKKTPLTTMQTETIKSSFNSVLSYSIIQEPTYQPWLFSLALAYSDESTIKILPDYRLMRLENVHSRIKYRVLSDTSAVIELQLNAEVRQHELELPDDSNPRARTFSQQLFSASKSPQDYINRVLAKFSTEEFFYTLKPPLLGMHSVDEFLFGTKKGFCSHYASSFVFLMRAAGIPARVVVGYQGGEVNPITATVLVHQFDAHAWAEVWFEGRGWVRVDPTAAVSPLRIEFGLEQAMVGEEEQFLSDSPLSPLRYRNIEWLNSLRLQMDAFNYYWVSWVLNYEGEQQLSVLKKLLGEVSAARIAIFLLGVGGLLLLLIAFIQLKGRGKSQSAVEVRQYLSLCKRLEKAGFKRQSYEAPIDYARRVVAQRPDLKQHVLVATRAFVALSYEPLPDEQKAALLRQLRRAVHKAKPTRRVSQKPQR